MKKGMIGLLILSVALVPSSLKAMTNAPDTTLVRRISQTDLAQGKVVGGGGDGIFVADCTYAYIAEGSGTSNAFQIFDISNPKAPILLGQTDLANGGNGVSTDDIWVKDGFA